MEMQFVFGNPKTALRKKGKAGKNKKVKGSIMAKKKHRKKVKKSSTRSKSRRTKKSKGKRKNPMRSVFAHKPRTKSGAIKKGAKISHGPTMLTPQEIISLAGKTAKVRASLKKLESIPYSKMTKKQKQKIRQLAAKNKAAIALDKLNQSAHKKDAKLIEKASKSGGKVEFLGHQSWKVSKKRKKKVTKKASKKKVTKKKVSKKVTKKRSTKRRSSKKVTRRLGHVDRFNKKGDSIKVRYKGETMKVVANPTKKRKKQRPITLKKKKSSRIVKVGKASFKIIKNPGVFVEKYTGFKPMEVGELALGGFSYAWINLGAKKLLPKVHSTIVGNLGSSGNSIFPLLAGILLNTVSSKVGGTGGKVLSTLGTGLVGASVVGFGSSASEFLQKTAGLSGAEFEGMGVMLDGQDEENYMLGYNGAEFEGAEFEGEDFGDEFGEDDDLMGEDEEVMGMV